jgi:hypothetical protein
MPSVLESRIGAERAQKGLLPGVLGSLARKQPAEVGEHSITVLLVELLERRHRSRCRFQGVRALPVRPSETTGRHD